MAGRIEVGTDPPYTVEVGEELDLGERVSGVLEPGECAVITDSNVGPLYLGSVLASLAKSGWRVVETLEIPAGENSKSLGAYADALRVLARAGLTRDATLFALGGGVVGDLGGFIAASYLRGIDLVMLPTTLLSMVDSSVGGKTGVDLPEGKNLVGAFFQPRMVLADPGWLATLPGDQISSGLAEVVKMALLSGGEFFHEMYRLGGVFDGDVESLEVLILGSIRYKAAVVAADERESGLRAVLNYGHTIGHALEAASGYELAHGEAVAIGMCCAARLSDSRFGTDLLPLHEGLLQTAGLPTRPPNSLDLAPTAIVEAMSRDKKRRAADGGEHRFVLLEEVGCPISGVVVTGAEALEVIEDQREESQ